LALFQSLAHAREEELDSSSDGVWAVARAPGTALVVTASEDKKVKLWKCDELEAERTCNIFSFYFFPFPLLLLCAPWLLHAATWIQSFWNESFLVIGSNFFKAVAASGLISWYVEKVRGCVITLEV